MAYFTYKRTLTDKVTIKGMLSEDGKIVTVTEKDGEKEVKKNNPQHLYAMSLS